MFLMGLTFFIMICENLSILSIDTIMGLKNSFSISLLINAASLSFNFHSFSSINSFSNSKRLFFVFKNSSFA